MAQLMGHGPARMLIGFPLRGRELTAVSAAGGRRVEPGELAVAGLRVSVAEPVHLREAGAFGLPLIQATLLDV